MNLGFWQVLLGGKLLGLNSESVVVDAFYLAGCGDAININYVVARRQASGRNGKYEQRTRSAFMRFQSVLTVDYITLAGLNRGAVAAVVVVLEREIQLGS